LDLKELCAMTLISPLKYRSSVLVAGLIRRLAPRLQPQPWKCGSLREDAQFAGSMAPALKGMSNLRTGHLFLFLLALGCSIPASAQNAVFNCSTFTSSGSCGVGSGQNFRPNGVVSLSAPKLTFIPTGQTHIDSSMWWSTPVNIQQFTSTFTFVPNGQNFAFVVQNNVGSSGNGTEFNSGAGCEAGFYQAFGAGPLPNNLLALELDSYSPLTLTGSFTYSSAQIYQANQSPCLPNDDGPNYTPFTKLSTYPVDLTTGSPDTTTGDVYSATVTYNGTSLTLNLFDVTKGGSCPGVSCYTQSWNTNIPSLVGGNTAYVGFTAATGLISLYPLYLNSFSFTEGTTQQATGPVFAPGGGTYSSAQSVTLTSASSGAVICYNTTGSPATNGATGCSVGTVYTGPIAVSANETLYAVAGGTGYSDSFDGTANYVIQAAAAAPTFSPAAGTYAAAQTVTISDATSGAVIYYTTDGSTPTTSSTKYTGPITVSSTEGLNAIAVAPGDSNSTVASAMYTINSPQPSFLVGTSPSSISIAPGSQATVTLTVTPVNGFASPVVLSCSGLPAGATCAFAQPTVTPKGAAASTLLTISTSASSAALRPGSRSFFPLAALAVTVWGFDWRKRRSRYSWLLIVLGCASLGLLSGCGSSGSSGGTSNPTSSTVTVTAISGNLQGSASIALTVQ
jgi:Chitobiase/beta-hexosaminidase C-terminal domain